MEKNLLMAAVFGEDVQYYPYLWWRREEVEGVAEETKTMFEGTASYSVAKVSVDSAIQEALESLDAEERDMLNLCFGLKDGKRKGYKEISKEKGAENALNSLKVERYCCRRMFLSHVEVMDKIVKYRKY